MSTTFRKFRTDNIVKTKYTAHKQYEVRLVDFIGSHEGFEDYQVIGYDSLHVNAFLKDSDSGRILRHDEFLTGSIAGTTYTELTTTNGFFKRSLHTSLAHLYYNGSHAVNVKLDKSFCVEPTRNEYRELNGNAQVLSIPQQLFGDKLLENDINFDIDNPSLKIINKGGSVVLHEDGFGNLYDTAAGGISNPLQVYRSITGSVVGYWGFNELYPYHQDGIKGHCPSFFVEIKDGSQYETKTKGSSVFITSQSKHGSGAMLTGQKGNLYDPSKYSYFTAKKHEKLDFRKDEDFAVSLWAQLPPSQSNTDRLFNYILTSGQGDHPEGIGQWRSKYPFDLVMYNQTAGTREAAQLNFFQQNYSGSSRQLLRVFKNCIETGSAASASIAFGIGNFANPDVSASFEIGRDASNLLEIVITGSTYSLPAGSNNSNQIFIPSTGGVFNDGLAIVNHINSAATQSAYAAKIGMISADIDSGGGNSTYSRLTFGYSGHLNKQNGSTVNTNFSPHAGNDFVWQDASSSFGPYFWNQNNLWASNVNGIRFESGVNSVSVVGGPSRKGNILHQPSESASFRLKDVLGTSVDFIITSASEAQYPNISVHGDVTSSVGNFMDRVVSVVNAGIETGATASSTQESILRLSSSWNSYRPGTGESSIYVAELIMTSSIAGDFSQFGNFAAGPGHKNMQVVLDEGNVFNNYGIAGTPEENDTSTVDGFQQVGRPLITQFTESYFILSCQPEGYTPASGSDFEERHVFYWHSGSDTASTAPDLGAFVTASTTVIDLGAAHFYPGTTAHISGAHDYFNIASRSYNAIDSHPSFSVTVEYRYFNETAGVMASFGGTDTEYGWKHNDLAVLIQPEHNNPTITGSSNFHVFPKFHDIGSSATSDAERNHIRLNIEAVTQGNTPPIQSGSEPGAMFSASAVIPLPINSCSMTLIDGNVGRPGQILARRNDGVDTYILSASQEHLFTDEGVEFKHILYQKTGSNLELYIDNTLTHAITQSDIGDPKNKDDIYFGVATRLTWSGEYERTNDGLYRINPGTGNPIRKMAREFMSPISGALDEIKILDKALDSTQRDFIYNCPNGTPFVGNVMHEHGIITITHPSSAYDGISQFCTASFKNTFEITENSYTAEIKRGEFNFTTNPTILDRSAQGLREAKISSFVTDTDWDPYITTIGLYDDSARLLAVGKLSRPLRKDDGYDTTIEVRFDT